MDSSTPVAVVCGLLQQADKFLLLQRSAQQKHPLQWEFPGGKIEAGECAEAALRREWQEELQVEIKVGAALPSVVVQKGSFFIELFPFYCQLVRGSISLTEHIDQAWLSPKAALQKDLSKGDRMILEALLS